MKRALQSANVLDTGVVFSSKDVTRKSLPRGLNEKAIEAARQMVFIPAMKDGTFVSPSVQVEYNFSIF